MMHTLGIYNVVTNNDIYIQTLNRGKEEEREGDLFVVQIELQKFISTVFNHTCQALKILDGFTIEIENLQVQKIEYCQELMPRNMKA